MKDSDLLQQVLNVGNPWQVVKVAGDVEQQVLDVWIQARAQRAGWFSRARPEASAKERVWRHVNIGGWRCMVHVTAPDDQRPQFVPWCGDADMPFTRGLSRQIAALLVDGVKIPTICTLLEIPLTDLWKFKFNLDSGKTGLGVGAPPTRAADRRAPAAPAAAASPAGVAVPATAAESAVPDMSHPVWEQLLEGSRDIEIRVLGLKFLLTKLREQMRAIDDVEVRMLKIHEIHRYFSRHEKTLGHELAQLA